MVLTQIESWHKRACPNPTPDNFSVQLGCHFEEIAEMVRTLSFQVNGQTIRAEGTQLDLMLTAVADDLKAGKLLAEVEDRISFVDSIGDQIVTATGAGYRAGFDVPAAAAEVNRSNWSKFDDNGNPIFNAHGKVAKGPNYREPNLAGCDLLGGVRTGTGVESPA